MPFSERFLNLVEQQLRLFESEEAIEYLVVYVAQARDGLPPGLEAIGQWPHIKKSLLPVESEPDLRAPSPYRRWYPLQEGSILLGVLRAERVRDSQSWSKSLDVRLQETASLLAQCLGLELDRRGLFDELNQQKENIGLMVHQLRNPLAALRTYAQLLLRKLGPDSKHRNLIEGLLTEQDQLNKYLSGLDQLTHSPLPAGIGNAAPLLLPPVLTENSFSVVKSLLQPLIERAEVKAKLEGRKWCKPLAWPEWTKKQRPVNDGVVAEIVANLLENAFNYSPNASSIGLFVNYECLCVWDEGPSIAEEEKENIFKKGFRGASSSNCSGSGLGLALARELANKIGGSLTLIIPPKSVDVTLPSSGNAFVLTLPVKTLT